LDVNEHVLPRKRSVLQKISSGTASLYHPSDPKEHFSKQNDDSFDFIIAFIYEVIDQPGIKKLNDLEDLLLMSTRNNSYEKS